MSDSTRKDGTSKDQSKAQGEEPRQESAIERLWRKADSFVNSTEAQEYARKHAEPGMPTREERYERGHSR